MDLMKVGICGRLHAAGVSRPRASEPPSAGVSQKPAGATMKTFLLGKHSCRDSLSPWWETGGL